MPPIRKPFTGDPLFPFEVVYKTMRSPQIELPDHLHDQYELVFIHQGSGTFFIDHTFYEKSAGDLFIIPGNTIHRSFPDSQNPIVSTALFFSPSLVSFMNTDPTYAPLACFDRARSLSTYRLELSLDIQNSIINTIEIIFSEYTQGQFGCKEAIVLHLRQLLLTINRKILTIHNVKQQVLSIGPVWMRNALRYIDEQENLRVGLSELAVRAAVSPAHFSRVFKNLTGMNVTDYVNAKRIVRAKDMIRNGNEGLEHIAESCGFDTLPHFHRVFKAITGVTPGGYRKGLE